MTYARARLWLGITGVGLMVALSGAGLFFAWPTEWFGSWGTSWWETVLGLLLVTFVYALLHVPLDYIGGYWLPCYFSRQCLLFNMWAAQYLRAAFFQGLVLTGSAMLILASGQMWGRPGAMVAAGLLMVFLVEVQDRLARIVAGLHAEHRDGVLYLGGMDAGFAGGLAGLPGRERLVLPSLWKRILSKEVVELAMQRRQAARGSRVRGLVVAVAFNLTGFYLASFLPQAGVTTLSEILTTALGFTLWSFVGLLVLPTLSRRGVFELDGAARAQGFGPERFEAMVRELDQLQDDEPRRAVGVEAIFHPVPSVERRLERYREGEKSLGAWNAARYALYLSWACLGFLNRAVHCNSGRPELWVMLPVD